MNNLLTKKSTQPPLSVLKTAYIFNCTERAYNPLFLEDESDNMQSRQ